MLYFKGNQRNQNNQGNQGIPFFGFFGFLGSLGFLFCVATINFNAYHKTMDIFLGLIGVVLSFFMIKYREAIGDTIGEAEWMNRIGGVYLVVIYAAIFIFLWSLVTIFGLTGAAFGHLLKPFRMFGF